MVSLEWIIGYPIKVNHLNCSLLARNGKSCPSETLICVEDGNFRVFKKVPLTVHVHVHVQSQMSIRRLHKYTRYALSVQYNGSSFLGVSHNPGTENMILPSGHDFRGLYSVEGTLRVALNSLLNGGDNEDNADVTSKQDEFPCFENLRVSSRTDRGVHALHNTLHVDIRPQKVFNERNRGQEQPWGVKSLLHGLNFHLRRQVTEYNGRSGNDMASNHLRVLNVKLAPDSMPNRFYDSSRCLDENDPLSIPTIDWNARYSATDRTYAYRILMGGNQIDHGNKVHLNWSVPFEHDRSWHIAGELDVSQMRQAAVHLTGTHDFSTFRSLKCQRHSPVVTLYTVEIHSQPWSILSPPQLLQQNGLDEGSCLSPYSYYGNDLQIVTVLVRGNAFLYRMVRNIVTCLVAVGKGQLTPGDVRDLLEARKRSELQHNMAPPNGLFLVQVRHGDFFI